ncbi:disulfide bond formation protein B [Buttiauxella agrestis]
MLRYLNQCSRGRGAWLLLAFTAFALEMVALWFQHVMMLKPCVMCIYERCALFGIMGAGIVGAIAPKHRCAMPELHCGFTAPGKVCN